MQKNLHSQAATSVHRDEKLSCFLNLTQQESLTRGRLFKFWFTSIFFIYVTVLIIEIKKKRKE